MNELSLFECMRAIGLKPRDVIVFASPAALTMATRKPIVDMLNAVFPDHESIILEAGQDIAVLRPVAETRKKVRRRSGGLSNG
jgi:hypothetical protein